MKLREALHSGEVSYYTCVVCVALSGLYVHWIPPFMIAMVIFRYFEVNDNETFTGLTRKSTILMLLFAVLLLWQIIGLIQADSLSVGIERIYKRVSILLFPLVLFRPSSKIKIKIKLLLKIFAVSLILYFIYCLFSALHNSISFNNGKIIFNQYDELYTYESYFTGLRLVSGEHPSYIAMYSLLALLVSADNILDSGQSFKNKVFWSIAAMGYIVFIVLLSSRAGILAGMIILPLFIFFRINKNKNSILIFLAVSSCIIAFFIILAMNNSRIMYSLEDASNNKIRSVLSEDIRVTIWRSAWVVIKANPIAGVGTGNASLELKKEFISLGYSQGFYEDLNAHNQFLEILLENGLIGLIIFLGLIGYLLYVSISENNYFLLAFSLMIIIFFVFESMLNRIAGVMFFPLFTFLLLHYKKGIV